MRIERVAMREFPPFADGMISFPTPEENDLAEVQLITGQNGTGKTRLLSALSAACGNETDLNTRHSNPTDGHRLAVAFRRNSQSAIYFRRYQAIFGLKDVDGADKLINNLDSLHPSAPTIIHGVNGPQQFQQTATAKSAPGLDPKSVLAVQAYRGTGRISDNPIVAMQPIKVGDPTSNMSLERAKGDDALICQSMANLKLSAAMEYQSGEPRENCRSIKITERFEAAIGKVTERSFSFQVARHPDLHLEVKWGGASMKLSLLPDGLRSIIAWLIACIAKLESQFPDEPDPLDIPLILLLDEPESHLHPAWQRQVIPAAQQLFPNAQIFAVTHSPFVISSVNSGWIHVLRMDDKGVVKADEPIRCSKGDSYLDAVEDVLGLTEWYDPETERLLAEFRELKKQVAERNASIAVLEEKAESIGNRSESLKGMMAREIHQARKIAWEDTVES